MAKRNSFISTVVLAICLINEAIAGFKAICNKDEECPQGACCIKVRKFHQKINEMCRWKMFLGQNCLPFSDPCCSSYPEYPPFIPQQQEHEKEFKKSFPRRPKEEEFPDGMKSIDSVNNSSAKDITTVSSTDHRREKRDIGHWFGPQQLAQNNDISQRTATKKIIILSTNKFEAVTVPIREANDVIHGSHEQSFKGTKPTVVHPPKTLLRDTRSILHGFDVKADNSKTEGTTVKTIIYKPATKLEAVTGPRREANEVKHGSHDQSFKGTKPTLVHPPKTLLRDTRSILHGFDAKADNSKTEGTTVKTIIYKPTTKLEAVTSPRREANEVKQGSHDQSFKGTKPTVVHPPKTLLRDTRSILHGFDAKAVNSKTEGTTVKTIIYKPTTKLEAVTGPISEANEIKHGSHEQSFKGTNPTVVHPPMIPLRDTRSILHGFEETIFKRNKTVVAKHTTMIPTRETRSILHGLNETILKGNKTIVPKHSEKKD